MFALVVQRPLDELVLQVGVIEFGGGVSLRRREGQAGPGVVGGLVVLEQWGHRVDEVGNPGGRCDLPQLRALGGDGRVGHQPRQRESAGRP